MDAHEALSRTASLLDREFFGGKAEHSEIVEGLLRTSVRITADQINAATAPSQHLIATLASLCARMGMSVELDFPEVRLTGFQLPLRGRQFRAALTELGDDLIPGVQITPNRLDVNIAFVVGDSPSRDEDGLRLLADDWRAEIVPAARSGRPLTAELPFGSLAASAVAAPEALRAALPSVAAAVGVDVIEGPHRTSVTNEIALDLEPLFPCIPHSTASDVGAVDIVSGGAITNSALYVLHRLPGVRGRARVIDHDLLDLSNLNRYNLARRSEVGNAKSDLLQQCGTEGLSIRGIRARYEETADQVIPLVDRVLVGVDHIPSRRAVQRSWPDWLCVGATQGMEVQVSTHRRGTACAGCLHRGDLETDAIIPTISFVSFWAGLLQALYLLAAIAKVEPAAASMMCWPFADAGPFLLPQSIAPQPDCEVRCPAARQAA